MWSQNVPEGGKSKGKVPKADMKLICSGTKISVCAGGERSPQGGRSGQETGEEGRLYAACREGLNRGNTIDLAIVVSLSWSCCLCTKAYLGCWEGQELEGLEGSKEATEVGPERGKRGVTGGNIFEVEQILGLLMDLDGGIKPKR